MRGEKRLTNWVLAKDDGRQSNPNNLSNTGRYVQRSRLHRCEPKRLNYEAVLNREAILQGSWIACVSAFMDGTENKRTTYEIAAKKKKSQVLMSFSASMNCSRFQILVSVPLWLD